MILHFIVVIKSMLLILLVDAIEQNNKQHSLRSLGKSIADRSAFPVIVGVIFFDSVHNMDVYK